MLKRIMLLILALGLLVPNVFADSQVTFVWDPHPDPLVGCKLYQATESGKYDLSSPVATTDPEATTTTIDGVPDGTWFWVITAYDQNNNESGFSNEVTTTIDTEPPSVPQGFTISVVVKVVVGDGTN